MQTATQRHREAAGNLTYWVSRLGARSFDARQEAGAMVCGHGKQTRQALVQGTQDAEARVRAGCVALLALIGEPVYREQVANGLGDGEVMVRRAALQGLSKLAADPESDADALTDAYCRVAEREASPVVRNAALHALGGRPYHAEAHALLARLAPMLTAPRLRRSALWALGQQERKWSVLVAVQSVGSARAPEEPLSTLETDTLLELLGHDLPRVRAEAGGVLFARGADALEAITGGFSHGDVRVRRAAVDLMDHLADDDCFAPLAGALRDADAGVRRGALHSLTCQVCKPSPLQGDRVAPLIERALTDSDARVRQVATSALADFVGDVRALEALRVIAQSGSDAVTRKRAASALEAVQGVS